MTADKTPPKKAPKTEPGRFDFLSSNPNVRAWVLLVGAVALHVVDEALSGFFPFYQNLVANAREQWGFFPMPVFPSFGVWLGGLIFAILIALALTPLVAKRGRGIRVLVTVLAVLMAANALAHTLGSVYAGRILPGFTSSFILFPAAAWMVYAGIRNDWGKRTDEQKL